MDNPRKSSESNEQHAEVIVKIESQDKEEQKNPMITREVFSFSKMNFVSPVIENECMNINSQRGLDTIQSLDIDDLASNKLYNSSSSEDDGNEDEHRFMNRQRQRKMPSNISYVPENESTGEVLKCTSFQRRASLVRTKTQQSRLMDPPEVPLSSPYGKPGGHTPGRTENNDDEDESLFDDDNPGDLKNNKLDSMTIIQWISLILILTSLICTAKFSKWKQRSFRGLFMWQWELLILVLICGRLVSGWCVRTVVFFIERSFLLRKRLLYFVYGVRTPVQNCIWLCWVLIAWNSVFDETVEALHIPLLEVINKFMICMLVATTLWLIKTLIVKVLASSFHVNKFFDRIQDALFNQYVIETLSGPPLVEIHNNHLGDKSFSRGSEIGGYSFKEKGGSASGRLHIRNLGCSKKHDQGITIEHLHRLNHENVSAWNMKRLMKIIRHGSLTTLDEHLQGTYYDEPGIEIRSEIEAKRAARSIFMNVTRRRAK